MSDLPQRQVIIRFTTEGNQIKEIEGASVRFNVQRLCYAVGSNATISIANLPLTDVNYLTTYLSPFLSPKKRKQVALYAGYDGDTSLIFEGDIWKAQPRKEGGDIWLNISAKKGFFGGSSIISKTINKKGMKVKDVCEQVAQWANTPLEWLATEQKVVDTFVHTGSITDAVQKLNTLGNINVYEEDGKIKVMDREPKPKGNRLISEETGMIGIPLLDHFGAEIKMLLDNTVKLGDCIQLKSKLIPAGNGRYWVYSINYQGSTRDNQFYSILKCKRGGAGW